MLVGCRGCVAARPLVVNPKRDRNEEGDSLVLERDR